jgi:hypothetical protein
MTKEQFRECFGIYPLRRWTYPKTRAYNGFTPDERIRGWQVTMWFVDNGWLGNPTRCSITGETGDVVFHNENYYTPWAPHEISRTVHRALHQRFSKPGWWRRIVTENARTGDEWFCLVSLDRAFDLAASQRATAGDDVRDVFARAPVPGRVDVPWDEIRPMIHPLRDI